MAICRLLVPIIIPNFHELVARRRQRLPRHGIGRSHGTYEIVQILGVCLKRIPDSLDAVAAAISFGTAVGTTRVLQGAHFASDAVIGELVILVTVLGLHGIRVDLLATASEDFVTPGGWLDTWPAKIRRVFQGKVRNRGAARRLHDN